VLRVAPASDQPNLFDLAHTGTANGIGSANQGVSNGHSL